MSLRTALKLGVDIRGISPECVLGILVAAQVYESRGVPFVVTSIKDSKHSATSLHYVGRAFDCRLPSRYTATGGTNEVIYHDLRDALGPQFDVVLEPDHIHVEFDPKVVA
jgi:hypothetical protein